MTCDKVRALQKTASYSLIVLECDDACAAAKASGLKPPEDQEEEKITDDNKEEQEAKPQLRRRGGRGKRRDEDDEDEKPPSKMAIWMESWQARLTRLEKTQFIRWARNHPTEAGLRILGGACIGVATILWAFEGFHV